MEKFRLPLLPADTSLQDVFKPMIANQVSGLVVDGGHQPHRLLHFAVLQNALESGASQLNEVSGGILLENGDPFAGPTADYDFIGIANGLAELRSRHEILALTYTTRSPGYVCTGPAQHPYPPNSRTTTSHNCVVPGCSGTI